MKRHIPNLLTSMNVLSGCIACVMAFEGYFLWVVVWVVIAAVFDFLDGFSARILKAYSPIGKELDSLADMVSFSLAPSILIFRYLSDNSSEQYQYLAYSAFLIAIFSALRLAKFNIDERQTSSFIGLPTPANALFWISLCYGLSQQGELIRLMSYYPVIVLVVIFSLLLTAEIPMFSLKVKSLSLKGNELRYLLFVFIIIAVVLWGLSGIAAGIILYILLSIISNLSRKKTSQK